MADTGAIFSPSTSILTVGGAPIRGRISGEFLTWSHNSPWFQMFPGVDGVGYFVLTEDRSATIVVRCQPNATENDILYGLLGSIVAAKAQVPITLTEGRTALAGLGVIAGTPQVTFSDGTRQKEWTILSTFMSGPIGGASAAVL